MDTHRVNLYEIEEKGRLGFEYRLAEVEGLDRSTVKDGDLVERNLNTLAMLVAVREKCPVAIVRESDRFRLAVPAKSKLENLEYHLAPDVVTLKPLNEVYPGTFCSPRWEVPPCRDEFLEFLPARFVEDTSHSLVFEFTYVFFESSGEWPRTEP